MIESIPGHEMHHEARKVMRYSSSLNNDYPGIDMFLVCTCGFEKEIYASGIGDTHERLLRVEHCIEVLAKG